MKPMNQQITVTKLRKALQKAEKEGLGDRLVVVSDDVEGNGIHGAFYSVTKGEELEGTCISDSETEDLSKLVCIG